MRVFPPKPSRMLEIGLECLALALRLVLKLLP
jgi:hypothetical protein